MPQTPYNAPVGVSYAHLAATTLLVKTGGGYFDGLVLNKITAAVTMTVYDGTSTSGTVIATIALPSTAATPLGVTFGVNYTTGLYMTLSAANADITVLYR